MLSPIILIQADDTVLFIARERFDTVYFDVPKVLSLLAEDHINSQFDIIDRESSVKDPVTWYRTKIDKRFFYGQGKDKKFRWLVYHQAERKPAQVFKSREWTERWLIRLGSVYRRFRAAYS